MPNHITTILKIGSNQKAIFDKLKGEKEEIDFEQIIPIPPDIFRGDLSQADKERTKGRNWREWCIKNWGTKWNAYGICSQEDQEIEDRTAIQFDTAWAHPLIVIEKLSTLFPETTFTVWYADEDIGSNLGHYTILNGQKTDLPIGDKIIFACAISGKEVINHLEDNQ